MDPNGKPSMVRLSALVLTLTAVVAVVMGRDAATVTALVGGGVVALLSRTKGE